MKISKNTQIFLIFVFISVALRFFSFFTSVLDHDESTYLIIGRDVLQGKDLYVDSVDSKPVGIFLIYAFFQLIFGYSIFLKRLAVSLLVGLTAYLLRNVSLKLFQEKRVAFAAGIIYIYYTSTWNAFGLSPNTELFFNFFTISSLLLFFNKSRFNYLIAGLLLGIGFIIKYLVLLDFIAIASFFFIYEMIQNKWKFTWSAFSPYVLAGISFAIPFFCVNFYFYLGDHFDAFRFITYELPGRYRQDSSVFKYVSLLFDFIFRFFPISILFFYVLFSNRSILKGWQKYLLTYWLFAVLLAIYLPGKGFRHYSIQLMLPLSLLAGMAFHPRFILNKYLSKVFSGKTGLILLVLLIGAGQVSGIAGKFTSTDQPRIIAKYLQNKLDDDDVVYVANDKQVLYYLLKKDCPTPYVHSTIFTKPEHAHAFNMDPEQEVRKVLDQNPKFVVVRQPFALVQNIIRNDYQVDKSFDEEKFLIYERIQ